jgi:predicted nucleic acid-binding protein
LNVVVDTNVVAYYLLRTEPFVEECRAFWRRTREVAAPSSWQSELANVFWLAIRAGVFDLTQGTERLRIARELGVSSVPVNHLWEGALARAASTDHPAYDTLFVELAHRLNRPLATFDESVLRLFPDVAKRPRDLVSAS